MRRVPEVGIGSVRQFNRVVIEGADVRRDLDELDELDELDDDESFHSFRRWTTQPG